MKRLWRNIYCILGIIGIIILDQGVKLWTVNNLALYEEKAFIPHVLRLYYVQNRGAAFGMLANQRWIFIALTLILVIGVMIFLFAGKLKGVNQYVPAVFIIGGGIANLIDRIYLGYVVDMFDVLLFDFAVFNVADSFVTVAAFWVIGYIIVTEIIDISKSRGKKEEPDNAENNSNS